MTSPRIPGFDLLGPVRESSSSATWRVLQRSLDRVVFVRMLKPGAGAQQREAFEWIARTVARIKHPNLIQVFDVSRDEEGLPYVVLEAVEGPTLSERLRRETRLDPVQVAKIGLSIADVLDTLWKQASLMHRNLKPDTFCLSDGGTVKMVEFGNATIIQAGVDPLARDEGLIVGTPNYMAPEQARGEHGLGFHADMYGLGCLLYHLLTGVAPFVYEADPERIMELQLTGTLPSPREANPRIPPGFETVLGRLLMKDCGDRYGWWQDVVADLQRLSLGHPVAKLRGAPPPKGAGTLELHGLRQSRAAKPGASSKRPGAAARVAAREGQRGGRGESSPPASVRGFLWCLLFVAWGVVALHRWNDPSGSLPSVPLPVLLSEAPRSDPVPAPPAASERTRPPDPSRVGPLSRSDPLPADPGRSDPSSSDLPVSLVGDVTAALANGDLTNARGLLMGAAGKVGGAESRRQNAVRALSGAGDPNDLVGTFLVDRFKGQKLLLNYRGRELTIEPERYAAGLLTTTLSNVGGGSHPWTLDLSTVDSSERLRLLGSGPVPSRDNRTDEIALALLVLQAGDREWARRMAGRVPELSPFLLHRANR